MKKQKTGILPGQKTITFSALKRLCVSNSDELTGKTYAYDGKSHQWVGIGMVERGDATSRDILVVEG